jgi:hypothetical protein
MTDKVRNYGIGTDSLERGMRVNGFKRDFPALNLAEILRAHGVCFGKSEE